MADSDVIGGIENLTDAVSGETPSYEYKNPNTDMMKAISKCVDAATGETGTEYEYDNPNTDVIQKMDKLAEAIASSGGSGGAEREIDKVYFQTTFSSGDTPLTITLLETANKTSHIKLTGSVWAPSIPTGYTATTGTISNNSFTTTETSDYHWDYVQEFDITCDNDNAVIVYNGGLNYKSEVSLDVYHIYNLASKLITQNGTYNASADSADGYNPVIVNVSGGGGIDYLESWIINSKSAVNIPTTTTHLVYTNGSISTFENADNAENETVTLGDISTFIGDASSFYWWVTANANMTYRIYNVLTGTLGALQTAQSGDVLISDGTISAAYCMEIRRYS